MFTPSKNREIQLLKSTNKQATVIFRAVGRSENPGLLVLLGGQNLPHSVEIGLTDLPKSGGATPWARAANFVKKPPLIVNIRGRSQTTFTNFANF